MDRSRIAICMAGLVTLFLASHAFVNGRFASTAKPAKPAHQINAKSASQIFDDASDFLWSATGQALSVGAALGLVFAMSQAPVRAADMQTFGDLESQVTVAEISTIDKDKKDKKVKELKADAKKVDEFTKTKVRTSEDKFREFTKDLDTSMASTERSIRAGPGVRSVVRKSLQKAKPSGPVFTGFEGLPALTLPALPALPSLPGLSGGSNGPGGAAGEDAALGLLSGAAVSLGVPAVVVAGAVNSRIQEKKREEAERRARAREAADSTGTILTAVAGVGAAVLVGNAILTNLPEAKEAAEPEKPPIAAAAKQSPDKAAAEKAAAEEAAADKAAAAKAAADKAAAEKAAADKSAADKAAADKEAADKAAADKAAAEKAAADKAAAENAAAEKAAADKAAADKAAAEKAAAEKAAAEKAAADKAAAENAAAKKVEAAPAPPSGEESTRSKIAKKGGYFAYMKEKQQQSS